MTVVDQANAAKGGATYQSLYDAMVAMGNDLEERAAKAGAKGDVVSARSQFLPRAQYYNQALYWVLGTDTPDREAEVYTTMNDAFVAAAALMDPPWERLEIPYEGGSMTGWFMRPVGFSGPRPTMILNNGSDGQNIDMVAQGGLEALKRGYNVLIFEGPGQGDQLFLNNVPFRADWQNVLTPVIDVAVGHDGVDPRGSWCADQLRWPAGTESRGTRAPTGRHRRGPGRRERLGQLPPVVRNVAEAGDEDAVQLTVGGDDPVSDPKDAFNLKKRLEIYSAEAHDQAREGKVPTNFYELSKIIQSYAIGDLASQIDAPTLVLDYQLDKFFVGQPKALLDRLSVSEKELVTFTVAEGAQYHCGPMAPQRVAETVHDWVAGIMST